MAYAQSKLALTIWSFHLAKNETDICVLALNPGSLLNTNMVREAYGRFWSPANKGAEIIYDLTVNAKHQNYSGEYFDNDKGAYSQAHPDAYDSQIISELIANTLKLLKK